MVEISDTQKAKIVMYRGLNYEFADIAEEVGVSRSTVSSYLNEYKDQAEASPDPITEVYGPVVLGAVFDGAFRSDAGSMLFGHVD